MQFVLASKNQHKQQELQQILAPYGIELVLQSRLGLELEVEESAITRVNIAKWGAMLNYAYLPADAADGRRHQRETERRGISDTEACLSRFYPELKAEIQQSWHRLFDPAVRLGSDEDYGNLWEIRREWIRNVIR